MVEALNCSMWRYSLPPRLEVMELTLASDALWAACIVEGECEGVGEFSTFNPHFTLHQQCEIGIECGKLGPVQ